MNLLKVVILLVFTVGQLAAQIKSPYEYFPGQYGYTITRHHQMVEYFKYLEASSDRVQLVEYGRTNQFRPLFVAFISNSDNIRRLKDIHETHLHYIGVSDRKPENEINKLLVWASFSVHGNEFSAMESAMLVAYKLLTENDEKINRQLEKAVIVIDPCLNPDGTDRYANWLRDISGRRIHPAASDREHMEPWPGGRYNHYYFDLNRDWAWLTQVESKYRIALYNDWLPHIHIDVHEMGYNEPYYFPPAAKPYHKFITEFQRKFLEKIGENNARYFDENSWAYYTRERFDLFYPSYGDTYPTFNGAVGMTYEKGGINAGRAVIKGNGDTLTVQDRIIQQATAVLSCIEVSANNDQQIIDEQQNLFANARKNPPGRFKSYFFKNTPRLKSLLQLLAAHGINHEVISEKKQIYGWRYQTGKNEKIEMEEGDFVIHADQPKAILTQVLLDPNHELEDSLSYDLTAWCLVFAYGLDCYGTTSKVSIKTTSNSILKPSKIFNPKSYAWVIPWGDLESAKLLSLLHQNKIKTRLAMKDAVVEDQVIPAGSLVILKADNNKSEDLQKKLKSILQTTERYFQLNTAYSTEGGDLGGENYPLLQKPNVLSISGREVYASELGAVWHFFDDIIEYPISLVDKIHFNRINLSDYNTLILPAGSLQFNDGEWGKIHQWVSSGGRLIFLGNALNAAVASGKFSIKNSKSAQSDSLLTKESITNFSDLERSLLSSAVAGAIIETNLDATHPLSFGVGDKYYSLKNGANSYGFDPSSHIVSQVPSNFISYGFVGSKSKKSLKDDICIAVEKIGNGEVVYFVDNPLFRGFWEVGKLMFSNALFFEY